MALELYLYRDKALAAIPTGEAANVIGVLANTPYEADQFVKQACRQSHFTNVPRISFAAANTVTFTNSTLTLTKSGYFAEYDYEAGDLVYISGGTASGTDTLNVGYYAVASNTDNTVVLASSPFSGTDDGTVMEGFIFNLRRIDWLASANVLQVVKPNAVANNHAGYPTNIPGEAFEIQFTAA